METLNEKNRRKIVARKKGEMISGRMINSRRVDRLTEITIW